MARPINANAEQTRRRILRGAARLFAERGLEGSSVREISKAAGVSGAMVSHCFGGKQALYEACIDEMYAELEGLWRVLEGQATTKPSDIPALDGILRAAFRFACLHRDHLRLLMRTVIDRGALDDARQRQYQAPFLEQGAALLGEDYGLDETERRLALQSLVHLVVRYALSAPRELALVLGQEGRAAEGDASSLQAMQAHLARVEAHLVRAAGLLLGPTTSTWTQELP